MQKQRKLSQKNSNRKHTSPKVFTKKTIYLLSRFKITGASYYHDHLEMKLDYTLTGIFQEMSLSQLETLQRLCELERTQILQSLALARIKILYVGYLLSGNRSNFIDYERNILWYYTCTKKNSCKHFCS